MPWALRGSLIALGVATAGAFAYLIFTSPDRTLDYVRVLVWPLLLAGLLSFVFLRYRENFGRLIDRINTVKFPGGEIQTFPQEDTREPDDELEIDEDEEEAIDEVVDYYEERLQEREQTVGELQRSLAFKQAQLTLERIYWRIFGSQINLLRALRSLKPQPFSKASAQILFMGTQAQHAPVFRDWSLDQYMSFLIRERLVEETPEGYVITGWGESFLDYTALLVGYGNRPF